MTDKRPRSAPLIAIVGVCASGKSTLANALRARGYTARQVLQEHSYVPYMWQRITDPDVLIYLHCSLDTTRARRHSPDFPEWIYEAERRRLGHAREHCDIFLETDTLTPEEIAAKVVIELERLLEGWQGGEPSAPT